MNGMELEVVLISLEQLKESVSDKKKSMACNFYKRATQGNYNIPVPPATDVGTKATWEARK